MDSLSLVALLPALAFLLPWLISEIKAWLAWCSIPGPRSPHSLLGHGQVIGDQWLSAHMLEWDRRHGPLVATRIGPVRVFFLSDPKEASRLLRKGPECLPKAPAIYDIYTKMTAAPHRNILTEPDGVMHTAVRRAALPAFSAAALRAWVPKIVGLTQQAAKLIEDQGLGNAVDVQDLCERINCDVIAIVAYGEPQGSVDEGNQEYLTVVREMTEAAHHLIGDPLWQVSWCWSKRARKDWESCRRFNEYAAQLAVRMQQAHKEGRLPPLCVGALLLGAQDPVTQQPFSLSRIGVELGTLASAGFEAASHGAAWALALLAMHPEVQDRLAAELDAAELLATTDRPAPREFAFEDCGRLRYLAAVIQEALRLFPPDATGTARSTPPDRSIEVCGHQVPPRSIMICTPYPMGLSKANYGPDALAFEPSRWLAHINSDQAPLREAMPFSLGPRDCIAQALARVELMAIVATLISRFEVQPAEGLLAAVADQQGGVRSCSSADPPSMVPLRRRAVYHINLTAKDGLPVLFKPRVS